MQYDEDLDRRRRDAYAKGEYRFKAPPVPARLWSTFDWCNFVQFNDPQLCGFMEPRQQGRT